MAGDGIINNPNGLPSEYGRLLAEIKERVRAAQLAAFRAANKELVAMYWDIGRMIVDRQKGETWGKSVVQKLAVDSKPNSQASGDSRLRIFGG